VNLPLLHRRWAGIAKVKKAGKENSAENRTGHGENPVVLKRL
jgi:hypothetical protein